jgi:uncharacterized protein (TIGR01244 family)
MRTILVTFLLLGACATAAEIPPPRPVEAAELGSTPKVHVRDGMWLAGQPKAEDLALLPAMGVRTVISLRPSKEQPDFDEQTCVEGLGLDYVNVPFGGPAELDDVIFAEMRTRLARTERPFLVHCASANRVGAVWIPFRVLDQGVELEIAVAEAKTIGLKTPELEAKALDYVARHAPKE